MRVLFLNDAPIIKYGIAAGMEELGLPMKILALWKYKQPEEQELQLRIAIDSFKPDAVFIEGHPGIHLNTLFTTIKELKQNLIYWAIEDPPHHKWISIPYARHSKVVFTTSIELIDKYKALGVESDLLLFACNPNIHKQVESVPALSHNIVFVGSNYDSRYEATRTIIEPLLKEDIYVWGLWWDDPKRPVNIPSDKYGGLLPYEELASVYASAKIVLGLHCDASSKTQTSMRTFEVLGCGAFYLTQYTPAHEHLFRNKEHLTWSRNPEETVRLVRHYLDHPEERRRIAQLGQEEVYKKHTYLLRAAEVKRTLERCL